MTEVDSAARENARRVASETADKMLSNSYPVGAPVLTQCRFGSHGMPSFAEGSPWVSRPNESLFIKALAPRATLYEIGPAVAEHSPPEVPYPSPEVCTPYREAAAMGFHLRSTLPIVFVKTRKGEVFLEARVAMRYLRENSDRFTSTLEEIASSAAKVFTPEGYASLQCLDRRLVTDVVQPYNSFTGQHISLRASLWAHTPPGINTVIGPPLNAPSRLCINTGSIETDWHHLELFIVSDLPSFDGDVLLIPAGTVIAQLFFVPREMAVSTELRFSADHPGAEPDYWSGWRQLGYALTGSGQAKASNRGGVASVQLACPHCFISVTASAEGVLPEGHTLYREFNPAYKVLKRKHDAMQKGPVAK
ncbi:MAG TPA: hypothetical protein VEJ84_07465 [Acidimicrobiales bacterium]|nr:hypothetical protein [Acidimicrobiales bacterium]